MYRSILNFAIYPLIFCCFTRLFFFTEPSLASDALDASERHLQAVTLQLKWKHQFQFAGYYAALEKGFYRKAGLDVRILEIKAGEESTDKVIEGKADFGVAMSDLILYRAKGQPVVALAAIFQHSPLIILTPKSNGIDNIHALKGKRLGMETHSGELIAYIENEGISLEKFKLVAHDYSISSLISGKVEAISAYSTDEPFMLLDRGIEYNRFTPRAGGIDFYGDTLFTSESQISEHPERVAAFVAASLKGWQYALANSEEIVDLILSKYTQRHSREHLLFEAQHSKSLIMADVVPLGYMHIGRWTHIAQTYANLGMIDENIPLDGFLYTPDSATDYGWLKRIIGILAIICSLLGLGALSLVFFNRKLSFEVNERKRTEEALQESELNLLHDITARKQTEARLHQSNLLLEASQRIARVGGWELDISTNNLFWTAETYRIHDASPETFNPTVEAGVKYFLPESRKIIAASLQAAMESGEGYDLVLETLTTKGRRIDVRTTCDVIKHEGHPVKLTGIFQDVTERKQAEAENLKLATQLQQAQKMESIGNLAGGIAHDFNNILSSIIGFTELALEAAPKNSPQREDLEEVYTAGNRAKELVQQILAFARQSNEEEKPVRLNDIVVESLKLLRPSTPTTIEVIPTIESTSSVIGNTSQLQQVVMNLCTNAIHSLQTSGGILEIGLKNTSLADDSEPKSSGLPAGEYVELTVTDNGSGIDPAIIEKIFEPYFTTKGVGEGTGMGLAMVKGIVESYRGDIHVRSESGNKTSFIIRLPVATGRRAEVVGQVDPVATGTERILFVDDEPPIARMGSRMLETLGYTVTIRTSSFDALELFKARPDAFDLVITDMTMPSMTGDELSMEVRKIRHDIPIILCTGYSNIIDEMGAKLIGIDAFAYKPFTKPNLAKTIREVLDTNHSSSA